MNSKTSSNKGRNMLEFVSMEILQQLLDNLDLPALLNAASLNRYLGDFEAIRKKYENEFVYCLMLDKSTFFSF